MDDLMKWAIGAFVLMVLAVVLLACADDSKVTGPAPSRTVLYCPVDSVTTGVVAHDPTLLWWDDFRRISRLRQRTDTRAELMGSGNYDLCGPPTVKTPPIQYPFHYDWRFIHPRGDTTGDTLGYWVR